LRPQQPSASNGFDAIVEMQIRREPIMNATASDAAEHAARAGRETAAEFRRRSAETRGLLAEELRAFLADVEELVREVANISDADVARVRVKVANALTDMRRAAGETTEGLRERARVAVDATDDYVRERPWTAIGIAAAFGLLVGVGVSAASRGRG
jgi:ElaB/YqjD/DUF883 family membrane-anchored ribosome-binding protein